MINPKLLKPKVMRELSSGFAENNPKGVQVQGFMETGCYKQTLSEINSADFKPTEKRDMNSCFEAKNKAPEFFSSNEFLSFIKHVTGKRFRKTGKANYSLRMFMHGNYTLMHDEVQAKGIEFYFDMTANWKCEWGGSTVFITNEGEKLMLPPAPNTLIVAEAGRSYVKYVNHLANDNGRLVVYGLMDY